MQLHVRTDMSEVNKMFVGFEKQIPYVMSTTINNTLLDAQQVEQERMLQTFIVRRPNFIKNSVKMIQFAKKDTLTGVLGIADIGGKPTADILSKFEDGGQKTSKTGGKVAIPTEVVVSNKSGLVTKAKRPRQLKNSFKIHTKGGDDLIMQRKGKGKRETIQVAYVLKQSVPIDSRLLFHRTAEQVINANMERHFANAYQRAIASSR